MQYLTETNIKAFQTGSKSLNCVLLSNPERRAFYLFLGGSEMSTNNRISVNTHGKLSKPIRINAMQFIAANVWSENLDVSDTTHLN